MDRSLLTQCSSTIPRPASVYPGTWCGPAPAATLPGTTSGAHRRAPHLTGGGVVNLTTTPIPSTELHSGRPAVRLDDTVMTYRALAESSARVAALLRERGISP